MPEPFFIKKETLAQVFSCEFCEISKNTFFTEHVWTTAFLWTLVHMSLLCISREERATWIDFMRSNFGLPYENIYFDVSKCEFILKQSNLKCWLFSPIFVVDIKLTFSYNFGAPLKQFFTISREVFKICKIFNIIQVFYCNEITGSQAKMTLLNCILL